ncbi:outer membrane beta-barrel protein [Alistipes sp. ZOR0009]|uniref:outer membrane beta-barrel protein n=1 Tax=Alistipes sp. ZOR0009 TaxID=1339253 RepID=UPI000648C2EB|nr:outer membrane beta-barrel protein [Alistipes sp. ZOR0009]
MKNILYTILGVAFAVSLSGQNVKTITGRILNEQGKPLKYVSVIATKMGEAKHFKGTLSSDDGKFHLIVPQDQALKVDVVSLGYKPIQKLVSADSNTTINLGDIQLTPAPIQLQEVVVKPLVEVSAGEIVYNITADPEREKSTMLQILGKVPHIKVDIDGNITMGETNSSNYVITRNGRVDALFDTRRLSLSQIMNRLSAMGFTKVCVVTNPPLKYGKVDYLLDIITDKSNLVSGAIGSTTLEDNIQKGSTPIQVGIIGSVENDLRGSTGVNFTNTSAPGAGVFRSRRYIASDSLLTSQQKDKSSGKEYGSNLMMSYDISPKQYLLVDVNYNKRSAHVGQSSLSSESLHGIVVNEYATDLKRQQENSSFSTNITLELQLRKPTNSLSLSYLFSANPQNTNEWLTSNELDGSNPSSSLSQYNAQQTNHKLQIRYQNYSSRKILWNVSAGFTNTAFDNTNRRFIFTKTGSKIEDANALNQLSQNHRLMEGTAVFICNIYKKLQFTGLANANYLLNAGGLTFITSNGTTHIHQNGLNLAPSLSFQYLVNEAKSITISFGYSFTQTRPSPSQLGTLSSTGNPNFIQKGNPNLRSQLLHTISTRYSSFSVNYSFSNNQITPYNYLNREGQIVSSWQNGGSYKSISIEYPLISILSKNSASLYLTSGTNLTGSKTSTGEQTRSISMHCIMPCRVRITKNFSTSLITNYYETWSKGYQQTRNSIPVYLIWSARYNVVIKDKTTWELLMQCSLLDWSKARTSTTHAADFEYVERIERNATPIFLSIKYNFGRFNVKPVRGSQNKAAITGYSASETKTN